MGNLRIGPYFAFLSKFWVVGHVITRSRTASGYVDGADDLLRSGLGSRARGRTSELPYCVQLFKPSGLRCRCHCGLDSGERLTTSLALICLRSALQCMKQQKISLSRQSRPLWDWRDPIKRSTYPFWQGERNEVGRSRIPIARTRALNAVPNARHCRE
jgi:hypothetical protein